MGKSKTISPEFMALFSNEQMNASGAELRDMGIQRASDKADALNENWTEQALAFLKRFVGYTSGPWQTEDLRMASLNVLPEPPSKRAWGMVIVKAKRAKLIRHVGYKAVSNPKAHRTPASVWVRV